jgi:hypothetical protein
LVSVAGVSGTADIAGFFCELPGAAGGDEFDLSSGNGAF